MKGSGVSTASTYSPTPRGGVPDSRCRVKAGRAVWQLAHSLHFQASLDLFLTTSSVSRAQNWQKSLFRHLAKELRSGSFQKKLSDVGHGLCSGCSSPQQRDGIWPPALAAPDTSSLGHVTALLGASVSLSSKWMCNASHTGS